MKLQITQRITLCTLSSFISSCLQTRTFFTLICWGYNKNTIWIKYYDKRFLCYLQSKTENSLIFWLTRNKSSLEMLEKEFKIIVVWRFTKKLPKSLNFFSKIWMLDLYLHRFELHVWLENPWLIVSLIFTDTEGWFADFIRSELSSDGWRCVIGLVELPLVFGLTVSWAFRNGPGWLVLGFAGIRTFLWMISAGAHDLWCRIQQD